MLFLVRTRRATRTESRLSRGGEAMRRWKTCKKKSACRHIYTPTYTHKVYPSSSGDTMRATRAAKGPITCPNGNRKGGTRQYRRCRRVTKSWRKGKTETGELRYRRTNTTAFTTAHMHNEHHRTTNSKGREKWNMKSARRGKQHKLSNTRKKSMVSKKRSSLYPNKPRTHVRLSHACIRRPSTVWVTKAYRKRR